MSDISNINGAEQMMDDPSSQLFSNLADFYRENGLVPEAIAMCQSGLESQPDNLQGRVVLAKCYLATKEFERARAEAVKVLSAQSENAEAKRILSEADTLLKSEKPKTLEQQPAASGPESSPPKKPETDSANLAVEPEQEKRDVVAPQALPPAAPAKEVLPASPLPLMTERPDESPVAEPEAMLPKEPVAPSASVTVEPPEIKPAPSAAVAVQTAGAPTAAPAEKQTAYGRILGDLVQTHQVNACLLVDESGYVVDEAYARQQGGVATNAETSAALTANVFKTAVQAIAKIKLGDLERIVIETDREKIFLRQAGRMMLMIAAEPAAKVGLVMVNSKRAAEQIETISSKNAR
jgi:predicted regulator of Ras-like GTPase activity (Roadblock/LC7/MglB family)